MIKSWQHKGLKASFFTGSKAGIRPDHVPRLARQLARLDAAESPHDMNGTGLEMSLAGRRA